MIIIGILLIVAAVVCWFVGQSAAGKAGEILTVQTSQINNLRESADAVTETLGKGHYNEYTELKGNAEFPELLTSEMGGQDCVYYTTIVEREWEEEYWETNDEGKRERKHRRGSDTMSQQTRSVPFQLNDGTGKVWVDPKEAELELETVVDRFESEGSIRGEVKIGAFRFRIDGGRGGSRRTLGYRFKELIFPATPQRMYVLGRVTDSVGRDLTVTRPTDKGQRFLVSYKSEEELVSHAEGQAKLFKILAILSGIAGIGFSIAELFVD
jgi:hypothetical protein